MDSNSYRDRDTLLAEVPHRQVVLTVPKRLRPYFLYHRFLLGDLSRVAARTVTAFIRATLGEHCAREPQPWPGAHRATLIERPTPA